MKSVKSASPLSSISSWRDPVLGVLAGGALAALRLPLQPQLQGNAPFLLAWPGIMAAAFIGGFWPAVAVGAWGLWVGQYVLRAAGQPAAGPGVIVIYAAFALVFAVAGGMRKRGLRLQRANAERLRQAQAQLVNVTRLNALGEMAGTLAHELNQPLTAIATYVAAARRVAAPQDAEGKLDPLLAKAAEQALRARDIISRMRAQVTTGAVAPAPQSLAKILDDAVALAVMGVAATAPSIKRDLDSKADLIMADRIQIQQVIVNLVRNAAEAMADSDVREVRITSRTREDGLVEIVVADSGPGLSPEVAANLFQPFVTGKSDGLGLGLSISRNIVEAHGGKLWADAKASPGAAFHLTLPAAEAVAAAAQ